MGAPEVPYGTSPSMLNYSAREIVAEAMRVMLLRHAKSKKAEGGRSDHARRLKGRGKSDAPAIGRIWRVMNSFRTSCWCRRPNTDAQQGTRGIAKYA
jgi:hypothetical protein